MNVCRSEAPVGQKQGLESRRCSGAKKRVPLWGGGQDRSIRNSHSFWKPPLCELGAQVACHFGGICRTHAAEDKGLSGFPVVLHP